MLQDQAGWKHSLQRHPGNQPGDGGQPQEVEVSSKYQRRGRGGLSRLHLHLCVWQQLVGERFAPVGSAEKALPAAPPPPAALPAAGPGGGHRGRVCVEAGQRRRQKLCRRPHLRGWSPRLRLFALFRFQTDCNVVLMDLSENERC